MHVCVCVCVCTPWLCCTRNLSTQDFHPPTAPASPRTLPCFHWGFTSTLETLCSPGACNTRTGVCRGRAHSTLEIKFPKGSGCGLALLGGGTEDTDEGCVKLLARAELEEVLGFGTTRAAGAARRLFCSPSFLSPPEPPSRFLIWLLYGSGPVLRLPAALSAKLCCSSSPRRGALQLP